MTMPTHSKNISPIFLTKCFSVIRIIPLMHAILNKDANFLAYLKIPTKPLNQCLYNEKCHLSHDLTVLAAIRCSRTSFLWPFNLWTSLALLLCWIWRIFPWMNAGQPFLSVVVVIFSIILRFFTSSKRGGSSFDYADYIFIVVKVFVQVMLTTVWWTWREAWHRLGADAWTCCKNKYIYKLASTWPDTRSDSIH